MTQTASPQHPARAGRAKSLASVLLFLSIAAGAITADLLLKYFAFQTVAGVPLTLERFPTMQGHAGPVVMAQAADGQWTPLLDVASAHPAAAIPPHEGIVIIPAILELRLTVNIGAVFGIGQGARWLFAAVSVIAVVVIGVVYHRSPSTHWGLHTALALIMGGAIGNLYDRVLYAGVRDMLHLFPGVQLPFGLAWPGGATELYPWIFNIADAALVCGVLLVLMLSWRYDTPKQTPAAGRG